MPLGIEGVFWAGNGQIVSRPFYMPEDYYFQLQDEAPWILEDLQDIPLLKQLINVEPEGVIFQNLKRDGHEHAFCYSCRPAMAVQPGVFVGFVDQPPANFLGPALFWVEWREESEDHPCYPVGWQDDFGGPVWTRQ